eukprot:354390-Chlamydomonas_euryale.AAC.2
MKKYKLCEARYGALTSRRSTNGCFAIDTTAAGQSFSTSSTNGSGETKSSCLAAFAAVCTDSAAWMASHAAQMPCRPRKLPSG